MKRVLMIVCVAAAAGCAAPMPQGIYPASPVQQATPAPAERRFTLSVNDEVEVRFPGRPDMAQTVRIRPDGRIALPFIEPVSAESKTPEELQTAISEAYKRLGGAAARDQGGRYLISENDELEVRFAFQTTFNQTVRVRPDGFISLSLVKLVRAEGRTPEELEADLIKRYREHLRDPELTVSVRSFTGNRVAAEGGRIYRGGFDDLQPLVLVRAAAPTQVFVGGEVQRPGVFPHRNNLTALQAILEAGGYNPRSELKSVMVIRKTDSGQPVMIRRDLYSDLRTQNSTNDIFLQPSDVVIVPQTGIAGVAQTLDQYVFQIVPFIRNSSFTFLYNLRDSNGATQFPFR